MIAFLAIILFVLIVGANVFQYWYNSSAQKGKRGESIVHNILAQLPDEYHLLDDVVLLTKRGTTQIDHVVVSRYGIFVIETKNYRGDIYGDDTRKEWTQIIPTDVTYRNGKTYTYITKNQFYNPVKQSLLHMYEIKNTLVDFPNLKVIPIVVFVGEANLSHVNTSSLVVYEYDLVATIRSFRLNVLSDEDAEGITHRLATRNVREKVSNIEHVQNIKKSAKEAERKIQAGICPKCGGQLVQRHGAYGSFWGCSNYPNCKYTIH